MFQQRNNKFTPIRSTIGKAVEFTMDLRDSSVKTKELGISPQIKNRNSLTDAATDQDLLNFWPDLVVTISSTDTKTFRADPNQSPYFMPDQSRHPFPESAPYKSIFAVAKTDDANSRLSRALAITFRIELLEPELIGGIVFSGYPALGYTIDKFGRTSSNYGLPREMRVSVASSQGSSPHENKFIDADLHYTKQAINYSSGFHFFHVEPTKTQSFTLQLSDFPLLMKEVKTNNQGDTVTYKQAYGLVIPYLYVYTYQEKSHYHHRVPGGVVGVLRKDDSGLPYHGDIKQEYLSPEWQRFIETDANTGVYQLFPAGGVFRPLRLYQDLGSGPYKYAALEQFVSDPVENGDSISLICQQCDETLRSIVGLELNISVFKQGASPRSENELETRMKLPSNEVNLVDKVGIKIYELDFPTGLSPLDAQQEKLKKYKHLLAEKIIEKDDTLSPIDLIDLPSGSPPDQRAIRFKRPSNHRYFEIELTNLGDDPGNLVVHSAAFFQSAQITLHPKLSRRLQVSRMHFRIVGSDLVEDYSRIGAHDFNFSIERLSGGQPIQQIIAIRSMADLMQSGMAKIMNNSRRRAIEFEKSNVYMYSDKDGPNNSPYADAFPEEEGKKNFESRTMDSSSEGYSKAESGDGVQHNGNDVQSFSNQEIRTHVIQLYPYTRSLFPSPSSDIQTPWEAAAHYLNFGHGMFTEAVGAVVGWFVGDGETNLLIPKQSGNPLENDFQPYWKGIKVVPIVEGMKTVTLSPFSPMPVAFDGVKNLIEGITELFKVYDFSNKSFNLAAIWDAIKSGSSATQVLGISGLGLNPGGIAPLVYNIFNGLNIGASLGFIGGISTGSNMITPVMSFNHSFGSQGTITTTASRTGYMKSETVRKTNDQGHSETTIEAGEHKRIVERRAVPDTDKKRIKGAEILWQGELKDIILGTVPLDVTFPALAERGVIPVDEALRVRFGNGISDDLEVDFWFEINESEIRDDF